mmetsp:Transcript_87693/g.204024  ORF Transcript_87693/g.204024 Transcript_87693/m.204024 type:complete len:215 (+) Transcript_87693:82-726(+)
MARAMWRTLLPMLALPIASPAEPLLVTSTAELVDADIPSCNLLQTGLEHQLPQDLATELPRANDTLGTGTEKIISVLSKQLEYELHVTAADIPVKNKLILAVLEMLGLGFCGVDRCYMGQTCLGVLKGVTLGGLTVWATLDYFGIVITCLSMSPSINALGIRGNFRESTITAAFVLTLVLLVFKLCCTGTGIWIRHHVFGPPKGGVEFVNDGPP